MLSHLLIRYGIRLVLLLFLLTAIFIYAPVTTQAQETIELEIGGEGSASWDFNQIAPGDSGTKTVELRNTGNTDGFVYIWICDIISTEGSNPESETDTDEPGELIDYLLFRLSGNQFQSNIDLPVTIDQFPQGAMTSNYVKVPLDASQTATLVWTWGFPETGQPQNDAQGDSLSFTINYTLLPTRPGDGNGGSSSGGGTAITEADTNTLILNIFGQVITVPIDDSGGLLNPLVVSDSENGCRLEFERGTRITSADGSRIIRIKIMICEEPRSPPDGTEMISYAYDIIGYTNDSVATSIVFDRPVKLSLSYISGWVPENSSAPFIAYYNNYLDWQELEITDDNKLQGRVSALISHASTFAVLVGPMPDKPEAVEAIPDEEEKESTVIPKNEEEPVISDDEEDVYRQPAVQMASDNREPIRQASLAVAVAGVTVMTILGYIERRRRTRRS